MSDATGRMDTIMRRLLIFGIAALVLGSLIFWWTYRQALAARAAAGPATPAAAENTPFPPFALTDQDGRPITEEWLAGHVTIVQFMFTSCPLACPAMTSQMETLQKRLKETGVQFLSLSFDPAHDSPEVLRVYAAERFKLELSNWRFATERLDKGQPPSGIVRSIYTTGLQQMLEEKSDDPIKPAGGAEGDVMPNINHSVNLFLVGPDGRVLGRYNSLRADEMNELAMAAFRAARGR